MASRGKGPARKRPPSKSRSSGPSGPVTWPLWLIVVLLTVGGGWVWYRTGVEADVADKARSGTAGVADPDAVSIPAKPAFEVPVGPGRGVDGEPVNPRISGGSQAGEGSLSLPGPGVLPDPPSSTVPATTGSPPAVGVSLPRDPGGKLPLEKWVAIQVALARQGISSGSIDGVAGAQTRAALREFQKKEGLPLTGEPDPVSLRRLGVDEVPYAAYRVTADDLAGLTTVPRTWLGKSALSHLGYESIVELVAERNHSSQKLIRTLNPEVDWHHVVAGKNLRVPAVVPPTIGGRAVFVRISLSEKALRVFDASSNLLVHFPCSIAAKVGKRPVGVLHVVRIAPHPNYRFDPEIFPESEEARQLGRKLMIPPGPNNPVGTAWIGLDRPGYGIHGTPNPEEVGRTESHGCFRLANWNAELLVGLVTMGMPVSVER